MSICTLNTSLEHPQFVGVCTHSLHRSLLMGRVVGTGSELTIDHCMLAVFNISTVFNFLNHTSPSHYKCVVSVHSSRSPPSGWHGREVFDPFVVNVAVEFVTIDCVSDLPPQL